jgi:hypothetical protein
MKKATILAEIFITTLFLFVNACSNKQQTQAINTITISGQVTDFDGNPIDSCVVQLMHEDFSIVSETYSDKSGHYALKDVEKGKYMAIYAIRPKEYPREDVVPAADKRLEFWAWNVIADKNLTINPRYHRLELYGFNVFEVYGGYPALMAYVRPMSVGKYLSYEKEIWLDKRKAEKAADISVNPQDIEFKIYAGNEPLKIYSVQTIIEYSGENQPFNGYFLQFERPKQRPEKYCIFRIEATHNLFGIEKGENIYFYEIKDYK